MYYVFAAAGVIPAEMERNTPKNQKRMFCQSPGHPNAMLKGGGRMEKQNQGWKQRGVFALLSRRSNSDVLGSYTVTPKDPDDEEPVQDVDDL